MSEFEENVRVTKLTVGVSSCLLGEAVRYDGGHRANSHIMGTLAEYFEFRSFCPEIDIGLGVPRTPIRLAREASHVIRCIAMDDDATDYTDALRACADGQRNWHQNLCGYIFKQDSPSCGMAGVKVWTGAETEFDGIGMYADKTMQNFPSLPCEEEDSLADTARRENFIQRVLAMGRWHALHERGISLDRLREFHNRHLEILMRHDRGGCEQLGKILTKASEDLLLENASIYLIQFMTVLRRL
ncbi:MAG: DUF1722 domain-containing protein [Proteobacteria bacterium]|nr:DUF1722 domain-containing protein [Pseudomonadota bacterium]